MTEDELLVQKIYDDPQIKTAAVRAFEHFLSEYPGAADIGAFELFKAAFLQGILFTKLFLEKAGTSVKR